MQRIVPLGREQRGACGTSCSVAHTGHTGTAGSANAGMFDRGMEEEACQAGNSIYGDDTVRCLLKNWQVDPLPVRCQEGTWGGHQLGGNVGTAGSFKSAVSASHRSMHAPCPDPNPLACATTCCFSVQVTTSWKGSRTLGWSGVHACLHPVTRTCCPVVPRRCPFPGWTAALAPMFPQVHHTDRPSDCPLGSRKCLGLAAPCAAPVSCRERGGQTRTCLVKPP